MNSKIRTFTDLLVWQEGHKLVVLTYKITAKFPKSEMYSLASQMRRSAASVTSNIAEGFGRQSYKEKLRFYYQAQGSLIELKDQILIAKDVGYLKRPSLRKMVELANSTHRLLQGLISKSKNILNSRILIPNSSPK